MARPYMLNDFAMHAQRLSAKLPPDDWDSEAPRPLLLRQASGVFDVVWVSTLDDAENDQLTIDTLKFSKTPHEEMEVAAMSADKRPGWLKRAVRCICPCFVYGRNRR